MRYAVVSDLHGNRQAWNSVLADIQSQEIDEIICLGDVIGYGPAPAAVLEKAYERVHHFVLGNHDAVLAGLLDPVGFNEHARGRLEWTANQLDDKAVDFFAKLPLVLEGPDFRCAHGTPVNPANFEYLLDDSTAAAAWAEHGDQICFVGHTHVPGLFVTGQSGRVHALEPRDFGLEDGKRYIVNPGSTGQPRDGDARASYCIFDTEAACILFRKVAFDIDGYRDDLARNNLSRGTSYFLDLAEAGAIPPVREQLDFRPSAAPVNSALQNTPAAQIEKAYRSARHWRSIAAITLVTMICATITGFWFWRSSASHLTFIKESVPWVEQRSDAVGTELLYKPKSTGKPVSRDNPLRHWRVALENPETQTIQVKRGPPDTDEPAFFDIESLSLAEFTLCTTPVLAPSGSRFTAKAQFRNIDFREGFLQVSVVELLPGGGEKLLLKTEPGGLADRPDRWLPTSTTLPDGLSRPQRLQYRIHGKFRGHVQIRKCNFFRRE